MTPALAGESESETCVHAKPIVFIVDDDVSVREGLESTIRFARFHAETYACARDFLERARAAVPSCLVLDVNLPDLSGLDLQNVVAAKRTDMPIIFITGYGDVPMSVKAMKAGAAEFFTKPFDDEILINAVLRRHVKLPE